MKKTNEKITDYLKRRLFWLKYIYNGNYFYFFHIFPVQRNKVVVSSYYGKGYGDNGKYIVDSLLENDSNLDIVWLQNENVSSLNMPDGVRVVKNNSLKGLFELATAKIWLDNSRKEFYPPKRKGQYYIQTWHSPLRLKKIEKDALDYLGKSYINIAKRDAKMTDLMISGSDFSTNIYRNSFWYNGEIRKIGTPRCDPFYIKDTNKLKEIKIKNNLKMSDKVLLFAPTFRTYGADQYSFDFDKVLEKLTLKFGGNWKILVRLHPNVSNLTKDMLFTDSVINATNYPDMQDLLLISDILLTDYSSSMFDAILLDLPCFLLVRDLEEYLIKERALYFELEELPFPVSGSLTNLLEEITKFNIIHYRDKVEVFKNTLRIDEFGTASETLANIILEKVGFNEKI